MGTLIGSGLYARAAEVLEDTSYVAYLEASLIEWVNDAQRAVVLVRPDAKASVENILLTASSALQSLPSGALRLGGLLSNMGADGATPGRGITGPVKREEMDAANPTWRTDTGAYVRQYVYDEDSPLSFWIYPTLTADLYVEAKVYRVPTDIAAGDDTIDLDDIYGPAIIEWLLYRCYARDSERSPNYTRASRHFKNFFDLLGVKTRGDMWVSPRNVERGRQQEDMPK
ncbi:MAG: hypothetical protein H6948_02205 [Zoogloeaceae bacterium]|nr:hypothetical protein [Zoogloeaceae bacterium]